MKKGNFKTSDFIWLFMGIAITVLFMVFSTSFYELLYSPGEFSNEMYNANMYLVVSGYTSAIVWIVAILYFLVIDWFDKGWIWTLSLILVGLISIAVGYFYCGNYFISENLDNLLPALNIFNLINFGVSIVFYFIITLRIKRLSCNCSTTPF